MSIADFFSRLILSQKDAEVIFDRDEPVGTPTDMVMPRRYWFRSGQAKAARGAALPANRKRSESTTR